MVERLGIFGGTFDPPHLGHLILGELALQTYELSTVFFIPSRIPPLKEVAVQTSVQDRLAMITLATEISPRFSVLDLELHREGLSYTIDTLRELHAKFPGAELLLFIGTDQLLQFTKWNEYEEILGLARVVACPRPGIDMAAISPDLLARVSQFRSPLMDLSSTMIRKRVAEGRSIRNFVPARIESYIRDRSLYR